MYVGFSRTVLSRQGTLSTVHTLIGARGRTVFTCLLLAVARGQWQLGKGDRPGWEPQRGEMTLRVLGKADQAH